MLTGCHSAEIDRHPEHILIRIAIIINVFVGFLNSTKHIDFRDKCEEHGIHVLYWQPEVEDDFRLYREAILKWQDTSIPFSEHAKFVPKEH